MTTLACLAAACGARDLPATVAASTPTMARTPTAVPTPTATPTPLVITPFEGTWTAVFTATDVSPIGSHFDAGTWLWIIHGTASTLLMPGGSVMDSSAFELARPNRIVFPAEPSCIAQVQPTTGIYTFRFTGNRVVFTKVQDSCVNRAFQLTVHPWTKAS